MKLTEEEKRRILADITAGRFRVASYAETVARIAPPAIRPARRRRQPRG